MTKRNQRGFTLIELSIVVLVIGILVAIAFPNYLAARTNSRIKTCLSNLRRIEDAKEMWAQENNGRTTSVPTQIQLVGDATTGYIKSWPECPENGTYSINNMATRPTCTVTGHVFP